MTSIEVRKNHALAFMASFAAFLALFALLGSGWPPSPVWAVVTLACLSIAAIFLRIEYRREPMPAMATLGCVCALPFMVSVTTALREQGEGRSKAGIIALVSGAVLAWSITFLVRYKPRDGLPNVLREAMPHLDLWENDDTHWGVEIAGSVRAKTGRVRVHLQNCLDAPRTVRVRVVSGGLLGSLLLHSKGRLRLEHELRLGPLEVGTITLPLQVDAKAKSPIPFSVEVRVRGNGRRLLRMRERIGKREMSPIWVALGIFTQVSAGERGLRWTFPLEAPDSPLPEEPLGALRPLEALRSVATPRPFGARS